ncbi:MAG: phytoene desaturase family protein [Candidatus Eiseniibacteriota bacterium]
MSRPDVLVIGAGVNGLVCAASLAKAGRRVVLLERSAHAGGLAAGGEFHPGYRSAGMHHDTSALRGEIVRALELEKHGLELAPGPGPVLVPEPDGPGFLLHHEADETAKDLAGRSGRDAEAFASYRAFFERIRPWADRLFREPPPDLLGGGDGTRIAREGWALRRLGADLMLELLRIGPMCVADWLDERFASPLLKGALAVPAVSGSFVGPWSPGTQANLVLHECSVARPPRRGAQALVDALVAAARASGVELRFGACVERIRVGAGGVVGVLLRGGETVDARIVAASCDPKTALLRLVEPGRLPLQAESRLAAYRANGTTAKVNLALSGELGFASRPDLAVESARIAGTLDDLERAFDPIKYGRFAESPALDVWVPTRANPSWAPNGHHVVSILVHFAPLRLEGGWDDASRHRLGDAVVSSLARYAPGLPGRIVAREVLAPPDIESRWGTAGGHVHHGDHTLDQLLIRPVPECARYATPIPGLFLAGRGSHPGVGMSGAPGAIAARVMLARR